MMKTIFTLAQSVKEIALGKRMVLRERVEKGKNPLYKHNIIISFFFLTVLLHIHFESNVFGGLSWLRLIWISHQVIPSSGITTLSDTPFVRQTEVDFVSCIIHRLTAEILQVATSPSPISEA